MSETICELQGVSLTSFCYSIGVRGIQIDGCSRGQAPPYTEMTEEQFETLVRAYQKWKKSKVTA